MKTRIYSLKDNFVRSVKATKPEYIYANYFCEKEGLYVHYSNSAVEHAYESVMTTRRGLYIPIMLGKTYGFHEFCEVFLEKDMIFIPTQKKINDSEMPIKLNIEKANELPYIENEIELSINENLSVTIPREYRVIGTRKISIKQGKYGNYVLVEKGTSPIALKTLKEYFGVRCQYLQNMDYSYEESSIKSECELKIPYYFKQAFNLKKSDKLRLVVGKDWYAIIPQNQKCEITGKTIDLAKSGISEIKICKNCEKHKKELKELIKVTTIAREGEIK